VYLQSATVRHVGADQRTASYYYSVMTATTDNTVNLAYFIATGVARSKYVGWTDMACAEREPITAVWRRSDSPAPPPCKNSSDLYQFQERSVAKVG